MLVYSLRIGESICQRCRKVMSLKKNPREIYMVDDLMYACALLALPSNSQGLLKSDVLACAKDAAYNSDYSIIEALEKYEDVPGPFCS